MKRKLIRFIIIGLGILTAFLAIRVNAWGRHEVEPKIKPGFEVGVALKTPVCP
ncbi:MAG: hypothetical protein MI975_21820 [Cytophagales bacterium]|nr:hypothetical protein [Cytophagales bacterium]